MNKFLKEYGFTVLVAAALIVVVISIIGIVVLLFISFIQGSLEPFADVYNGIVNISGKSFRGYIVILFIISLLLGAIIYSDY